VFQVMVAASSSASAVTSLKNRAAACIDSIQPPRSFLDAAGDIARFIQFELPPSMSAPQALSNRAVHILAVVGAQLKQPASGLVIVRVFTVSAWRPSTVIIERLPVLGHAESGAGCGS